MKTSLAPGLEGGDRLPRRTRGLIADLDDARLQPGRLRLHDLHRQPRAAARAGRDGDRGGRPRRRGGALGQPQLRGPRQPADARELPGLAAAGRRLRARRHASTSTSTTRAARHRPDRASRSSSATSGRRSAEVARRDAQAVTRRAVPRRVRPTCSRATSSWQRHAGARPGDRYAWDAASTYVKRAAVLRGHDARAGAASTDIRGARVLALLGDSITTDHISPAGLDQGRQPGRPLPASSTASSRRTSTPTARAAATTR